jgi:hypothetical protein
MRLGGGRAQIDASPSELGLCRCSIEYLIGSLEKESQLQKMIEMKSRMPSAELPIGHRPRRCSRRGWAWGLV